MKNGNHTKRLIAKKKWGIEESLNGDAIVRNFSSPKDNRPSFWT